MRKLIEDSEGDVYGPMVCVIPLEEYDIKEHDIYQINGMGNLEFNNDPSNRYRDIGTHTYGYRISKASEISHYIPHNIVVTHFVYLMYYSNRESIDALIRELKIDNLSK